MTSQPVTPVTKAELPRVLTRRSPAPGIEWQARISTDRQRLEVGAVVEPSPVPVFVHMLTTLELQELLNDHGTDEWGNERKPE